MLNIEKVSKDLEEFCIWAEEIEFKDIPEEVALRLHMLLSDSIGAIAGGRSSQEIQHLLKNYPSVADTYPICIPEKQQGQISETAFINSIAMAGLELDEGSRPSGHPALHLVPALLAESAIVPVSGEDFLRALLIGYEVQARIQWGTSLRPMVHPHGNFGYISAAVAVASLRNFDREKLLQTILVSVGLLSASSWQPAIDGSTVRNIYAAQSSLMAAHIVRLVEAGYVGSVAGFYDVLANVIGTQFDSEFLSVSLGKRYYTNENYFKFHSACALVHPVLDALGDAVGAQVQAGSYPVMRFQPNSDFISSIDKITLTIPERSMKLNDPRPETSLGARFSIPFAAATFLVNGHTGPASFEGDNLTDQEVLKLIDKVELIPSAEMTQSWPRDLCSEAEITLKDKTLLKGVCVNPIGSYNILVDQSTLYAKFTHLLRRSDLDTKQIESLWHRYWAITEVREITPDYWIAGAGTS